MPLRNPFISYITRSYEQMKDDILTKFGINVPEITDHTESNPWVKGISIWSGIGEMLGYYIDNKARESFLQTCIKFASAVKHARQNGYRVRGNSAASVDLTFTLNVVATSQVVIPIGTLTKTVKGTEFRTTLQGIIDIGEQSVQVPAKQWTPALAQIIGTSDGSPDQVYVLVENVVDGSITVKVNTDNYQPVDTFAFSIPTDEHFVGILNEENKMQIEFGDDMAGKIPPSSSDIEVTYYTSEGLLGNVGPNTISEIDDTITVPTGTELSVNNLFKASGGSNSDTIEDIRKNVPKANRTLSRAVTPQDFIDIAELVTGVAKAGENYECGRVVDLYIIPEGGGIASNQLLQDVEDFFEDKRIITKKVNAVSAGEVLINIISSIRALPNYSNEDVKQRTTDNLLEFLSSDNQEISGTVYISDIYEVIEKTEGVNNSDINLLSTIPFPRPIGDTINLLNWTVEVRPDSVSTIKWKIRFVAVDQFELVKEDTFVGNFNVGITVNLDEVVFTVHTNGSINDVYEFNTYEYNSKRIVLEEPSIPVASTQSLFITVTGGIE